MKSVLRNNVLLNILFLMVFVTSCFDGEVDGEKDFDTGSGFVSIVPFQSISESSRDLTNDLSAPKSILISIKDSNGLYVLNLEKLDLTKLGDSYITSDIELPQGAYTISDFLVLNEEDSAIYLVPKIGSEVADFSANPLPMSFQVYNGNTTNLSIEVMALLQDNPKIFGYGVFSFRTTNLVIIQPNSSNGIDASISNRTDYMVRNFGNYDLLRNAAGTGYNVGSPNQDWRFLIKFDFDKYVNSSDQISSAYLKFHAVNDGEIWATDQSGSNRSKVYRIIEHWNEDQVTWENRPAVSNQNTVLIPRNNDYDSITVDVTALAKDIVSSKQNYGFLIKQLVEDPYSTMNFYSSDYHDYQKHPSLILKYTTD